MKAPTTYSKVDPSQRPKNTWLTGKEYERAGQRLSFVSHDVLITHRLSESIFLAKRIIHPMKDWWYIGGAKTASVPLLQSMSDKFEQETGLTISPHRLELITTQEFEWSQPIYRNDVSFIFELQLSPDGRREVSQNLDPNEYDTKAGLKAFNREGIMQDGVHPAIQESFRLLFD